MSVIKHCSENGVIDLHYHPELERSGNGWSPEADCEDLAKIGISSAVPSVTLAADVWEARSINQQLSRLCEEHNFAAGFLASIPPPFEPKETVDEIGYAFDRLGAIGIALPSNMSGIYPSDERLQAVLQELNERKSVVQVHPTVPGMVRGMAFEEYILHYEFPFDTTRFFMELVYNELFWKYPNIKWVASHAGGTLPFIYYRLANMRDCDTSWPGPDEIRAVLSSLYYDLSITSPEMLLLLESIANPTHILYGSDYSKRGEHGCHEHLVLLREAVDEARAEKYFRQNALRLFGLEQ